jgi:hypothetical protein
MSKKFKVTNEDVWEINYIKTNFPNREVTEQSAILILPAISATTKKGLLLKDRIGMLLISVLKFLMSINILNFFDKNYLLKIIK